VTGTGSGPRPDVEAKTTARGRRKLGVGLALFGAAFAVYLTTFSLAGEPFQSRWVYGADTSKPGLRLLEDPDTRALYHLRRRPLFVVVSAPVYEFGRAIFGGLPKTTGRNLALAFGPALAGALAVVVAWSVMRRVCGGSGLAAPALLLYAASGSTWFFASYPDSYAAAALAVNLFLLGLLRWPVGAIRAPALANALAALVSPPLLLLSVIPGLRYLRQGTAGLSRSARYAGAIALLYFLPVLLIGGLTTSGFKPARMGFLYRQLVNTANRPRNADVRADPATWAAVVANHALYATVTPIPNLGPDSNIRIDTHYPATAILESGAAYALVAWPFLALLVAGMALALGRPPPTLPFCRELLAFLAAYLALIGWVNPSEPFLYTAPLVLPLLVVPVAVFAQGPLRPGARAVAWVMAVGAAAINVRLVLFLRTLL